jgi:hypothetical protein
MATKTLNYTNLVNTYTPATGYMMIGYTSSGFNHNANVTFPALGVSGVINEVRLYYAWNNSGATEGFQAATTHKAGNNTYPISGSSGSGSVVLTSGYSNTSPWTINISGAVATASTSKGYYKGSAYLYVVVTYTQYTACGAPTSCSVSSTLSEGNVTLSWSGASNGVNNTISSYEIQYSESTDNATWGAWTALTTVTTTATSGSLSVSPSSTRGNYRRFQVRTRGTAGAGYYSGWKVSTNSVRRNTVPKPPTTVTASPAVYSDETITLSWSGASSGTSPIKGYQIASRTSTDNSTWSGWTVLTILTLSASSGNYNPQVSRDPGTYTQFGIWTIDTLDVYSLEKISNSIYCDITACVAPAVCSVNATLAEGNVTLSWSGAAGGAGNAITSYEIQYSDSTDNSTWGPWTELTIVFTSSTSGSLSVSPTATRGHYRRFRVRTRGTAGESLYSDWAVSSNTVRRNTLPTPPTTFTATPVIYEAKPVTLIWSGTIPGTSAIKQYVIQRSTSNDGTNWTAYEALTTVVSSATSGTYTAYASQIPGTFTRYRISVTDTLDAVSAYGEIYRRVHWNNRGKKSIVWRCVSRLENTGLTCHSRTVLEDMIGLATVEAINKLIGQKDGFLTILKENIETVISETDNNIVAEIDKKLEELQKDLLRLANSKEDYNDIADEIYRLREERHKALAEEAGKKGSKQRLEDMEKFLNEQSTLLEEYDEQLVRRLIEKITVYEDKLTVEFKSGTMIDVVL